MEKINRKLTSGTGALQKVGGHCCAIFQHVFLWVQCWIACAPHECLLSVCQRTVVYVKAHVCLFFPQCPKRTFLKNVADSCLTKQSNSDHWTYSIHTLGHNCDGWNSSTNVTITVKCPEGRGEHQKAGTPPKKLWGGGLNLESPFKSHHSSIEVLLESDLNLLHVLCACDTFVFLSYTADLVKNFKCVLEPSGMNCSWIPVHPSHELKLSHRWESHDTSVEFEWTCACIWEAACL